MDRAAFERLIENLDRSAWGRGDAKDADDLWREVQAGDCALEPGPVRLVRVVEVHVERGGRVLVEAEQVLADGRVRPRARRPSEKMRPDEPPRAAALRCLAEEMGIEPARVELGRSHPPRIEEAGSISYPGLLTRYTLFRVEAAVAGLPEGPFTTAEAGPDAPGDRDPVRLHRWAWCAPEAIERAYISGERSSSGSSAQSSRS